MNKSSQVLGLGVFTMAILAFAGCQSSDNVKTVGPATDTTRQEVVVENAQSAKYAQAMYGKRTYTIAESVGGGHNPSIGVDGGGTQAIDATLQDELTQRGYVYEQSGPVDFVVTPHWSYTDSQTKYDSAAAEVPTDYTSSTRQARLTVVITAGSSDTILWTSESNKTVLTSLLSADVATIMAHEALRTLPAMNPGTVASSTNP